jgi:hypothetical protein
MYILSYLIQIKIYSKPLVIDKMSTIFSQINENIVTSWFIFSSIFPTMFVYICHFQQVQKKSLSVKNYSFKLKYF